MNDDTMVKAGLKAIAHRGVEQFFASFLNDPYSPQVTATLDPRRTDRVINAQAANRGAEIYDDVYDDPRAHAMFTKRVQAVSCRPLTVLDEDAPADAVQAVRRWIDEVNINDLIEWLEESVLYGFAAVEWQWRRVDDLLLPVRWRGVRPGRMRVEDRSEETGEGWRVRTLTAPTDGEHLPYGTLTVLRHRSAGGAHPYGRGVGALLWYYAYFKRQCWVMWLSAAERFGTPIITVPAPADDSQRREVQEAVAGATGGGYLMLPEGVEAQLHEAAQSNGQIFAQMIERINEEMTLVILGEVLTSTAGPNSRAAAAVHDDIREEVALRDSMRLGAHLRRTVLRWIMAVNFDNAPPPKLRWDFDKPRTAAESLELLTQAQGLGYTLDEKKSDETLTTLLGMPMTADDYAADSD